MRRVAILTLGLALGAALAACAAPAAQVGKQRFQNRDPVWVVNDRRDVPTKPKERSYTVTLTVFDSLFYRRLITAMELKRPQRALDINSLGGVPDSTWFENRIGTGELTPSAVARGPNQSRGPDLSRPLVIESTKAIGAAVGFVVRDARDARWVLKFDTREVPYVETANEVIVQRLLWAAGYHVPENSVVYLRRDMLELAPDATIKNAFGREETFTRARLHERLDLVFHMPDGRLRALASRFLPGKVIGGFPHRGTRPDDPNDTIPHEHRRSLRGLYVFSSWVQHTDIKSANTADVYVEDPDHPGRHFVVHYLLDFGKALGAFRLTNLSVSDGYRYSIDPQQDTKSLLAFGLWKRPWEDVSAPELPGLGVFEAEHYDPGTYRPHRPTRPFTVKDRRDMFWAAKILAQFTPAHIRAAVEQGALPDPRTEDYLVNVLLERQWKTVRYWFRQVNPVDDFRVRSAGNRYELCFRDLLVHHDFDPDGGRTSRYRVVSYDFDGASLGWSAKAATSASGAVCASGFRPGGSRDGYTILRVDTWRGKKSLEPVEVHLAKRGDGILRVIGVHRH